MLLQRFVEVHCICFLHFVILSVFSFFMPNLLMWTAFPFTQRKKSSKSNATEDDGEGDDS